MTLNRKILLFVLVPLVLAMTGIGMLIYQQATRLSQEQSATLARGLVNAKKAELRYYTAFALNSISSIYRPAAADDREAKEKVKQILSNLSYGPDGYFFVYDFAGNNIVHPRQSFRIGKNWWDLRDAEGNYVIQDLIAAAKAGGGYTQYVWEKPSAKQVREKIGYAVGLEKWQWMVGTGLYTDDIAARVSTLESYITTKTTQTFFLITTIVFSAMALIGAAAVVVTYQQQRIARAQLKTLNRRIIETQEHERTRVARELHDGISQHLTSTKFILELAQIQNTRAAKSAQSSNTIKRGIASLTGAIAEIRRISRDLRPGMLDDLGLAPAITSLSDEFAERTGLEIDVDADPVKDMLPDDAKTALFRVVQEALNNIVRHAEATSVKISLKQVTGYIELNIHDNGAGFDLAAIEREGPPSRGIGLKNMRERVEYYQGTLTVVSDKNGTTLSARLPIQATRVSAIPSQAAE